MDHNVPAPSNVPSLRRGLDKPGHDSGKVGRIRTAIRGARPEHLCCDLSFMGRRNKQDERHGGTAALVFSLHHLASKHPRLLIGGGRRRRHITEPGWRRRSGLRWRRASRSRLLGARVLSPVISVEQPESPETGECRG